MSEETTSIDLKTLATIGGLIVLIGGGGGTLGVAINKATEADARISTHVAEGAAAHPIITSRLDHTEQSMTNIEQRLATLDSAVDKSARNQLRICIALSVNCAD